MLVTYWSPPRLLLAGDVAGTSVHDNVALTAVGPMFSAAILFFVSRVLKATRSVSSIVFQAFALAVYSLQPDSNVSISALVGGMSMPFCVSGPRTVL